MRQSDMSLIAELKRRNVIRAAGLYLVGAWLVVQVASTVLPAFDGPAWALRSLIIALVVGFVPAMIVAWVFELTPEGLKRDAELTAAESIAPQTGRRMDRLILIVAMIAIGYFVFDKFVLAARRDAALVTQITAHVTAEISAEKSKTSPKSVAVLPFLDLSPEHDQGYFSDGMSEEILNALAQVQDLKVAGRTSSFYYKDRNEDLRTIGKALGVANVLEGSVRKQGEQVRITAQLIRSDDDFHLWSETYDGDLKDVFALQERIARAITDKLKITLIGAQQTQLVAVATTDT
jgi:TolB-like protein